MEISCSRGVFSVLSHLEDSCWTVAAQHQQMVLTACPVDFNSAGKWSLLGVIWYLQLGSACSKSKYEFCALKNLILFWDFNYLYVLMWACIFQSLSCYRSCNWLKWDYSSDGWPVPELDRLNKLFPEAFEFGAGWLFSSLHLVCLAGSRLRNLKPWRHHRQTVNHSFSFLKAGVSMEAEIHH